VRHLSRWLCGWRWKGIEMRRVKAKMKVTDIIIAWVNVEDDGAMSDGTDFETIDYIENLEAEIIEEIETF
jgi:hypothetical protein